MFNRCREIETLKNILRSTLQLYNYSTSKLGQISFGRKGEKGANCRTPVLLLNLRSGMFHSIQSLVNSLSFEINTWLKEH